MRAPARHAALATALLACAAAGCSGDSDDDPSHVGALRLLAVVADPPEVPPGGATALTATVADPSLLDAGAPRLAWSACLLGPAPGSGATNLACLASPAGGDGGAPLVPLGEGLSIAATLPAFDAALLSPADQTGGVYLPIRLDLGLGATALTAIYRLRITDAAARPANRANANPTIASVTAGGGALDPAARTVVAGPTVSLAAHLAAGSAEGYQTATCPSPDPCPTEAPSISWFTTAGTFDPHSNGDGEPATLTVPGLGAGASRDLDVWAVARDGRGGSAVAHRLLTLTGSGK